MTRLKQIGLLLGAMAVFFAPVSLGHSEEPGTGCADEAPVLRQEWRALQLWNPVVNAGEWRLPLSASRTEIITEARMRLELIREGEQEPWKARITFLFPDPKPFGLPFSFQKAEFHWSDGVGPGSVAIADWSSSCMDAGRSLFPGQQWSEIVELPGTEGASVLYAPSITLWGSRN